MKGYLCKVYIISHACVLEKGGHECIRPASQVPKCTVRSVGTWRQAGTHACTIRMATFKEGVPGLLSLVQAAPAHASVVAPLPCMTLLRRGSRPAASNPVARSQALRPSLQPPQPSPVPLMAVGGARMMVGRGSPSQAGMRGSSSGSLGVGITSASVELAGPRGGGGPMNGRQGSAGDTNRVRGGGDESGRQGAGSVLNTVRGC